MQRIIFLIVVSIVGFLGGYYVADGIVQGRFIRWEILPTPPGKIVGIFTATYGAGIESVVIIHTQEQKIYRYDPLSLAWKEIDIHENYVEKQQYHCTSFSPPALPDEIIHRFADTDVCLETKNQKYYVVLADNSVWQWSHTVSYMASILYYGYSGIGLIAGLLLGIVILVLHRFLVRPGLEVRGS